MKKHFMKLGLIALLACVGFSAPAHAQYDSGSSYSSSSSSSMGFTLGGGMGTFIGAGWSAWDLGVRADVKIVDWFSAGLFFDLLTDLNDVGVDVGARGIASWNIPKASDTSLYGGVGIGYIHLPGADDAEIQLITGVEYKASDSLSLRSEIGYNMILDMGAFAFQWLPIVFTYHF